MPCTWEDFLSVKKPGKDNLCVKIHEHGKLNCTLDGKAVFLAYEEVKISSVTNNFALGTQSCYCFQS